MIRENIILVLLAQYACAQLYFQPEQIHLAFGDSTNDIVVTWSTFTDTPESVVEYGINGLATQQTGSSKKFVDGGKSHRTQYIHKVTLSNLTYDTKYVYHCGSKLGWSEMFWFKTPPPNDKWQPHLAIYGDLGNVNAQSLPRLQQETQKGMYDAILHIGDFAYDMDSDEGKVGDEFMRQIEAIAGYLPYMTCPGNHENAYNFSHYKARFNMPGDAESLWYSIDMGPVHMIFITTEIYYNLNYGIKDLVFQYDWLENDLARANLPQNRAKQPWIIVLGHRPMYCSTTDGDDCNHNQTLTRVGLPFLHWFGLEDLFYDYGVDLEIWAHEHAYERCWPVYNYRVYNGSYQQPYVNPGAPVHLTTGSAGCQEKTDKFTPHPKDWSALRSSDYGYTRMKAYNSTHLYLEQVSDDKDGAVIDSFWLIKDTHGPYENSKMDWEKLDEARLSDLNL